MTFIQEIERVENPLPFNPISEEYITLNNGRPILISPPQARYILAHHNKTNRPKKKTQINEIYKSIEQDKFYQDGQPITFDTTGNLTEKQHTLEAITRFPDGNEYPFMVTVGVDPDCFSMQPPAKNRTAQDELLRKYPEVTDTEYRCLGDLVSRQRGQLRANNVVGHWQRWGNSIKQGIKLTDTFWNDTNDQYYATNKKTVNAFCTFAYCEGIGELAQTFLEYLANEFAKDATSTALSYGFNQWYDANTNHMHNVKKGKTLYRMLCYALDRMLDRDDGAISFPSPDDNITLSESEMKNKGRYLKYQTINPR